MNEELIEEAVAVASVIAEVRSRPLAALTLFVRGRYVTDVAVRAAYRELFDFVLAEIEAEARPEDETIFDTLDHYARKLSRRSAGSSAKRARERLRAAGSGARLADINFANLALVVTGHAPTSESLEALAIATGMDAMTRESLAGQGPVVENLDLQDIEEQLAQIDIHTLRGRVEEMPWAELCASRDFVAGLAELARAMLVPAEHQEAPEALGLRELALQSDAMLAVEALAVVPFLDTMQEGVGEWTATAAAQTPVYRAITSLLEELPPDLRAKLPRLGDRFVEELDPTLQPEVANAIRVWSAAHPEKAQALSAAADEASLLAAPGASTAGTWGVTRV